MLSQQLRCVSAQISRSPFSEITEKLSEPKQNLTLCDKTLHETSSRDFIQIRPRYQITMHDCTWISQRDDSNQNHLHCRFSIVASFFGHHHSTFSELFCVSSPNGQGKAWANPFCRNLLPFPRTIPNFSRKTRQKAFSFRTTSSGKWKSTRKIWAAPKMC